MPDLFQGVNATKGGKEKFAIESVTRTKRICNSVMYLNSHEFLDVEPHQWQYHCCCC